MTKKRSKLLVLLPAGLGHAAASDRALFAKTHALLGNGNLHPLRPPLPALTCSVQATFTTGLAPEKHGIVGNGFFFRETGKVSFWEQSGRLVQAPRVWDRVRARGRPDLSVGLVCVQHSWLAGADLLLTPWPIHAGDGRTISSCYARPAGLYEDLAAELGPFPLHHYWGPLANRFSTEWIVEAAKRILRGPAPELLVVYLPHLDYNHQRFGPEAEASRDDLGALDGFLAALIEAARERGYRTLIASDYALVPVKRAVPINRALREAGWLSMRTVEGRETLDIGGSRAFAVADHQLAHVHLADRADRREAAELLGHVDGVDRVLAGEDLAAAGLGHARSGDLVCLAEPDAWFAYEWWLDEAQAPDFARKVDIHNKPGYDPLELFWGEGGIARDHALVKGSHGRSDGPAATLWADFGIGQGQGQGRGNGEVQASGVAGIIESFLLD